MRTIIVDHPLIEYKLTLLREAATPTPVFSALVDELVILLAYEATRGISTVAVEVQTPITTARGVHLAKPRPMVVPILRAGLGMLDGMRRLLPTAEVGFLGMVRDEDSLVAHTYADRLPKDLSGRQVYLLDPMLATGGTLVAAIDLLLERHAKDVTVICLLAAPEGLHRLQEAFADRDLSVTCVCAGLDTKLNDKGYIVPGLGDAGDRLYGVV
jgi:uracil phosphoribosyltransferase